MSLVAPKTGGSSGNFVKQDPVEVGSYPARLVRIVSLGLQPQEYKGEKKAPANEIILTYELVDEFMKDENGEDILDKPRWQSERMTLRPLDSDLAKSTARYNVFDPKGVFEGDFTKCLGSPCSVAIGHTQGGNAKILDVAPVRARDAANMPDLQNDAKFFDLSDPDMELFEQQPQWIKDLILSNLEFKGSALEAALGAGSGSSPKNKEESKPASRQQAPVEYDDLDDDIPF